MAYEEQQYDSILAQYGPYSPLNAKSQLNTQNLQQTHYIYRHEWDAFLKRIELLEAYFAKVKDRFVDPGDA